MHLTVGERILLHLAEFGTYAERLEVPSEMAQQGIADAAGIYPQHVKRHIDPLLREGYMRERSAHVHGHQRRLKVYHLTDPGQEAAGRLREQVKRETVRVRDAAGVRATTIGDLLHAYPGKVTVPSLVSAVMEGNVVDIASVLQSPAEGFVARLAEAPRTETFVGRRNELDALISGNRIPRVFVVRGVPGIGKSSLAAKACEHLKESGHVYWHRIRPWDTRLSILAGLAEFLAAIGLPGLQSVLKGGNDGRAEPALREDLETTRCVLVFDDAHNAGVDVLGLLRFLKEATLQAPALRLIVLSRRAVSFYDRRDVSLDQVVHEIDLQGLQRDEIALLLPDLAERAMLMGLFEKFGGHPLFVELVRASLPHGTADPALSDMHRFLEEEVYEALSDRERRMMKVAALYQVPFPRESVLVDPSLTHDVFLALMGKSLIRPVGNGVFSVHDTVRDYFESILSSFERKHFAPVVVAQLVRLSDMATAAKELTATLNYLLNAHRLAPLDRDRAVLLERLGDAYERLGDLPAALAGFTEAAQYQEEPESIARIHRKAATALHLRGQSASADAEIGKAFEALGDRTCAERGWLDLLKCRVASAREDWAKSRAYGEAALETFVAVGDLEGQAETWLALGRNETFSPAGSSALAEHDLQKALALKEELGDPNFEARLHSVLVELYTFRFGNARGAETHLRALDALEPSIADPHIQRRIIMLRGWFALLQEADFGRAEEFFTKAAALGRRIHDRRTEVYANYGIAQALLFRGNAESARKALQELAPALPNVCTSGDRVDVLWTIAECSMVLGDLDGFTEAVEQSSDRDLAEGMAARPIHAKVLHGLGRLLSGDKDGCRSDFEDAIRLSETRYLDGDIISAGFVHFYYGVALIAIGRESEGTQHVRRAIDVLQKCGMRAQSTSLVRNQSGIVASLRMASPSSR